ncbi:MAG: Fe-S-containing hydro-lyase [Clostridia bacterium]|nr:Fe-S-containing hydro-lyase [Clostridia bacterium]
MRYELTQPLTKEMAAELKAGDMVVLTGTIYAARDAAHKKLQTMIQNGEELPFDLEGAMIYYAGPTPARPGYPIGSAGPTTSGRMDPYTPELLARGVRATIGKGPRSREAMDAMAENTAVYFAAIGGAAALISQCIESADVVAFDELGTEAIRALKVNKLPLVVACDSHGKSVYERD